MLYLGTSTLGKGTSVVTAAPIGNDDLDHPLITSVPCTARELACVVVHVCVKIMMPAQHTLLLLAVCVVLRSVHGAGHVNGNIS